MYTNVLLICASVFLVPGACRGYQRASNVFRRSYGEWEAASWWWKLNLDLLQVQEVFWRAQSSLYLLFSIFSWGVGEHLFCFPAAFYPIVSMSTSIVVTMDSYKMLPSVFSTFSNKAFPATYPLFFFFLFPGVRFFFKSINIIALFLTLKNSQT